MRNPVEIYEILLELLSQKVASRRLTDDELNRYFIPEGIALGQNYFERLASSLQNSGMMHNSIRFNDSALRYEHIKSVLCQFDFQQVQRRYSTVDQLYLALTNNGTMDNGTKKTKETNWQKYAKGLFDGVQFLANGGSDTIRTLCQEPATLQDFCAKIQVLKTIKQSIHGLGFPLTCDWLKECGCQWLAKPDVHIQVVCSAIVGRELTDMETIETVFELSKQIQQVYPDATAYKIDKVIWLICTGNFYMQNDGIGRDTILSSI